MKEANAKTMRGMDWVMYREYDSPLAQPMWVFPT
jgi:hypothetical protein